MEELGSPGEYAHAVIFAAQQLLEMAHQITREFVHEPDNRGGAARLKPAPTQPATA